MNDNRFAKLAAYKLAAEDIIGVKNARPRTAAEVRYWLARLADEATEESRRAVNAALVNDSMREGLMILDLLAGQRLYGRDYQPTNPSFKWWGRFSHKKLRVESHWLFHDSPPDLLLSGTREARVSFYLRGNNGNNGKRLSRLLAKASARRS